MSRDAKPRTGGAGATARAARAGATARAARAGATARAARAGATAKVASAAAVAVIVTALAGPAAAGDLDPRFTYLLHLRASLGSGAPADPLRGLTGGEDGVASPDAAKAAQTTKAVAHSDAARAAADGLEARGCRASAAAVRIAAADHVAGSVRFRNAPSAEALRDLETLGVRFSDFGRGPAGSRTVYPADLPWASVAAVAGHPDVACVAPGWRVAPRAPLAVSRPQVQADQAWALSDALGRPLTGQGTLIADFDTGIQLYHPAFFVPDAGIFDWIDADQSGDLSAGDAVDLNNNQAVDPGEALRWIEAEGTAGFGNDPERCDTSFDWLYNDADGNQSRDHGPQFGEHRPGYGELLFYALDEDHDGRLDPGERLAALGTSKVRAVRGRDGYVGERGVNLLQAEGDYWGHGTAVSGILCGGWPDTHRMSGVAPGAELLHAVNDYTAEPPFLVPMEDHLAWAASYDPDIFLIEDGEWIWEFMDGSSNVETMLNEYAADEGIICIVPAGNLATGLMHARCSTTESIGFQVGTAAQVVWASLLWLEDDLPTIYLSAPGGSWGILSLDGTTQLIGPYEVYSGFSVSVRGTRRVDLRLEHETPGTLLTGNYDLDLIPGAGMQYELHGFIIDNVAGWISATHWDRVDPQFTVTWPATADSAISVAAYDPDGDAGINSFSGWGPRIDGRAAVDLAAPGSTVTSTYFLGQGRYTAFGGTSAAGPHVAGAAALARQLWPDADHGRVRGILRAGARTDPYTTDPDRWGAGKLRIHDSLQLVAATPEAPEAPSAEHAPAGRPVTSGPAFLGATPSPGRGAVTLRWEGLAREPARLVIRDLTGRQLCEHRLACDRPALAFEWDACDARGRRLPAGLYWVQLTQAQLQTEGRVALLR